MANHSRVPPCACPRDQFAALSVLANAIEATNSVDTETVASYLRGSTLSEFFANMTFNADGQAEYDYHVLQYQPFIDPVTARARACSSRPGDIPADSSRGP